MVIKHILPFRHKGAPQNVEHAPQKPTTCGQENPTKVEIVDHIVQLIEIVIQIGRLIEMVIEIV